MYRLYYSPGACSLASHVALEEAGAEFEAEPVWIAKREHQCESYRKVNPRGLLPALDLGDEILVETIAILTFVARKFPAARLLPDDPVEEARCYSLMAFLASTVHVGFGQIIRPAILTTDATLHADLAANARKRLPELFDEIDRMLEGREWYADTYSVCDPYLMVFYHWGVRLMYRMEDYRNWSLHMSRLQKRPAVRTVLKREGLPRLSFV